MGAEVMTSKEQLRAAFDEWCKGWCSPGANSSEWYWTVFQGGAEAQRRLSGETGAPRPFSADPIILRGFAGYFHQCAVGAPPRAMSNGYAKSVAETFDGLADWLDSQSKTGADV
jgi:hypothetical protein